MAPRIRQRRPNKSSELESEYGQLLAKLYSARGVQDPSEVQYRLKNLYSYDKLKGLQQALDCLQKAKTNDQHVMIVGDFDADGATSTALAVEALKRMGYGRVSYIVPSRFEYGYGLSPEIVEVAAKEKPDWIMTVDNGIGSHQGIETANAYRIGVIVTDHHLPGDDLPKAEAIVNPNQPGDEFPGKYLAGVGVIFYVMLALRQRLQSCGLLSDAALPNMAQFLDLVALGTVADVVPLDSNNRILVKQGIKRIRAGQTRPGIQALVEAAKRDQQYLTASDLGFGLGPRLNAAGRLEDMSYGIECLLARDWDKAREMAQQLDSLNRDRRQIEDDMKLQAEAVLDRLKSTQRMPYGVCLYEPDWHQGIIGLVASRVKERWHRPVIAFAPDGESTLKGSARSIAGLHIRDTLDVISKKHPGLLPKFGGHAMAAGLSIEADHLADFKSIFDHEIKNRLSEQDLQKCFYTDGRLDAGDITLDNAELLRDAGPWGQSFPEPMFNGTFYVVDQRLVGMYHLKMTLEYDGHWYEAIAFNVDLNEWPNHGCRKVSVVYQLDVNIFRQQKRLQLLIEHIEAIA